MSSDPRRITKRNVFTAGYHLKWKSMETGAVLEKKVRDEQLQSTLQHDGSLYSFDGLFLFCPQEELIKVPILKYYTDILACGIEFHPQHTLPVGFENIKTDLREQDALYFIAKFLFKQILYLHSDILRDRKNNTPYQFLPTFVNDQNKSYLPPSALMKYLQTQSKTCLNDVIISDLKNTIVFNKNQDGDSYRVDLVKNSTIAHVFEDEQRYCLSTYRPTQKKKAWMGFGIPSRQVRLRRYEKKLDPATYSLTGFKSDVTELATAVPLVLKHLEYYSYTLADLQNRIGFSFADNLNLLRNALTHPSFVECCIESRNTEDMRSARGHLGIPTRFLNLSRKRKRRDSGNFKTSLYCKVVDAYERLEFLGDSILGFVISLCLFLRCPSYDEGDMTTTKSEIVNNTVLGKIGISLKFDRYIQSAFDRRLVSHDMKNHMAADAIEALIGAIYLQHGLEASRRFIGDCIITELDPELKELFWLDENSVKDSCRNYVKEHSVIPKAFPLAALEKYRTSYEEFNSKIANVKNLSLWLQAMTHKSFVAVQEVRADGLLEVTLDPHYERLEFLGDRILQMLMSIYLFENYPAENEYMLSSIRSAIVRNHKLGAIGKDMGILPYVRLGPYGDPNTHHITADVFEALIGATFLENVDNSGLQVVNSILKTHVHPLVDQARINCSWNAPKGKLTHFLKQWRGCKYINMIREDNRGDFHFPFTISIVLDKFVVARARGKSIEIARELACAKACRMLGIAVPQEDLDCMLEAMNS